MPTLIVYASKTGCTEACAQSLAKQLDDTVTLVNIAKDPIDLSAYDTIVIGSYVRMGQLDKKISQLLANRQQELMAKRLGFFLCCASSEKTSEFLSTLLPKPLFEHSVLSIGFGGELREDRAKGIDRFIIKMVKKSTTEENPPAILPQNIEQMASVLNEAVSQQN